MNDAVRAALRALTLQSRAILTQETEALLQGVYGVGPDGALEPRTNLPAVRELPEAAETRARIERYLHDAIAAGRTGEQAVKHLARETAFTHLNRLVAVKLLEARKLIRGAIDRHHASNGYLIYLGGNDKDYKRHEQGAGTSNALSEGPRDESYRHFLLWQSAELAREVRVLFDPETLSSRLFPQPVALKALIDLLNDETVREAWQVGNEETIGWVYQFFNEEEKAAAFERVQKDKQKFRPEDIPAATQLFTPRWIVRFLVENALGREWLDLHPDSRLRSKLDYLVPRAETEIIENLANVRLARDITLLDPACGTMHFGLVAFDLFAEMYREEISRAGESGWPALPSVEREEDIAAAIIANNLFGVDIDLRAVQLSALALYVKAKSLNPRSQLTQSNLACADVTLPDIERLNAFLAEAHFTRPVYERVMRALWLRLKDAGQLGSLLRIEQDIRELIERERLTQSGDSPLFNISKFADAIHSDNNFWETLDSQIVLAMGKFARQHATGAQDEGYFVGEAVKGFRLLDVLMRRYRIVVANPPYLSNRNMNVDLSDFLKASYPEGKGDLYAAFAIRCSELTEDGGRVGMLTQQSFMFISSYEPIRKRLRSMHIVEQLLHLGPRAFDEIPGQKVNVVAFVLRREVESTRREAAVGTYFRLAKASDAQSKQNFFERALIKMRSISDEPAGVFEYRQQDFDAIPGSPWVYWITNGLRNLFLALPRLGAIALPRQGLATTDNARFLRFWWEIGKTHVVRDSADPVDSIRSHFRWFPYMKGGGFKRWSGNEEYCVDWYHDGMQIKEAICEAYPYLKGKWGWVAKNTDHYFRRGVTWTDLTHGKFSARLSPGGFVFDVSGSSAFPRDERLRLLLGVMNSQFAQYALKLINPTMHVQVGDLARLPIPDVSSPTLDGLVDRAVDLARQESFESETTYDFAAPPDWYTGISGTKQRRGDLAKIERDIGNEVYRVYNISAVDRVAIEQELTSDEQIAIEDIDDGPTSVDEIASLEPELSRDTLASAWVSYTVGVALGRFRPTTNASQAGVVEPGAGRFPPETASALAALADSDGIVVIDPRHPDDLTAKVRRALELIVGDAEAEVLIATATGAKPLADWLAKEFFKRHLQQYRKRPVYWLLQSPRRHYSLLLFHERLTRDSLPLIAGAGYARGRLNALDVQITALAGLAKVGAAGRERRQAEKVIDDLRDARADVQEFIQRLEAVVGAKNARGETVGWQPELDDGVLINVAPLRELMPAWTIEPKKAWEALAKGEYDWSRTAMRYWPDRVLAKCKTNKSYVIAHGLER